MERACLSRLGDNADIFYFAYRTYHMPAGNNTALPRIKHNIIVTIHSI